MQVENILPLTDFKRNTARSVKQLHATRRPLLLTVNGRPELVVLDAAEWQAMQERMEIADALLGVQRGLGEAARGETVPLADAMRELRKKHGVSR